MKKIMNWLRNGWNRVGAAAALTVLIVVLSTFAYAASIPKEIMGWGHTNVMAVKPVNLEGMGSGFWIDNETFVTACHVVGIQLLSFEREDNESGRLGRMIKTVVNEVAPEAQVANSDGSAVLNLKVVSCNFETDVAILKRQWLSSDSEFTASVTPSALPNEGEEVFCTGFGLGMPLHTTIGHWVGPQSRYKEPWSLATCPTIFGDSGSPVLVLRNNKVYWAGLRDALAAAKDTFVEHLTMITTVEQIEAELER